MVSAKQLYEQGNLKAALEQITSEVKARPLDTSSRIFLFGLLCFAGELDRAEKQLDVIAMQEAQSELSVVAYRNCLRAEKERRKLWSEDLHPHFLKEPPIYVDLHLSAINHLRQGKMAEARELLDQAEEERPAMKGRFNDQPFEDFRDYNDATASILELIIRDQYTWVPFDQIRAIEFSAPTQLRDLLWCPATIEAIDGTNGEAFVPTLYVNSWQHQDDRVRMGRMTDWVELGTDLYQPMGQRLFLVDNEDQAMLETRTIEFDLPETDVTAPNS